MREILFRGKRIDINEWIEGYYAVSPTDSKSYIYAKDYTEVDISEDGLHVAYRLMQVIPETVGQYTGLTDKNGKKIFEGNIVSIYTPCNEKHNIGVIRFGYYASGIPSIFKTNLGFYIEWASEDNINRIDFGFWIQAYQDETEVIGNIHDNPELLEVTE